MSEQYIQHPDVLLEEIKNGWWAVRLNRPKALHALDESIVVALHSIFQYLHDNDDVKAVWFDSTTPKAFCAGADIRKLRQAILDGDVAQAQQFFAQEYALDRSLHHFSKPIVVWGEGYVMGGGLGLFMSAPFRLVTRNSKLAMPEIHIGLYPDVGATRFLADRGQIGLFIGMTGSIMTAAGGSNIGWATHVCDSDREKMLQLLTNICWDNYAAGAFRAIADTLDSVHRPMAPGPMQISLDVIYSVCRGQDFVQDYQAICGLSNASSEWLRQASENIATGSPTSVALTWLLWQWGVQHRSWDEVFDLEQEISAWQLQHPDFVEGVRARIVDKDLQPKWQNTDFKSLADLFKGNAPVSNKVESWNQILQKYELI